jgi:hypothetical protein
VGVVQHQWPCALASAFILYLSSLSGHVGIGQKSFTLTLSVWVTTLAASSKVVPLVRTLLSWLIFGVLVLTNSDEQT